MIQIEITGATGTGHYDVYVCDTTLTYCDFAGSGVLYNVGLPCIDDACNPIPPALSQTPTPTTPCTPSYWEIVLSGTGNFTIYACGGGTTTLGTLIGGTFYFCSSIQPTSTSSNLVSVTNVGACP